MSEILLALLEGLKVLLCWQVTQLFTIFFGFAFELLGLLLSCLQRALCPWHMVRREET